MFQLTGSGSCQRKLTYKNLRLVIEWGKYGSISKVYMDVYCFMWFMVSEALKQFTFKTQNYMLQYLLSLKIPVLYKLRIT